MFKNIFKIIQNYRYDFKSSIIHTLNKKIFKRFNLKLEKEFSTKERLDINFENFINIAKNYSMCSFESQKNIVDSVSYIARNNIEGDFVECGVWKGGNLLLLELVSKHLNLKKNIYGYDLFDNMPEGGEHDVDKYGKKPSYYENNQNLNNSWCKASIEQVKDVINQYSNNHNISLIKGDVCSTLKLIKNTSKISLLRLDTDFYESTKFELEILFPKLSKGGILIIDDYNQWQGSRKAVDEYFNDKNFFYHQIKNGGIYLIKE